MTQTTHSVHTVLDTMMRRLWIDRRFDEAERFFDPSATIHGAVPGLELCLSDYIEAIDQISLVAQVRDIAFTEVIVNDEGRFAARADVQVKAMSTGTTALQEMAVFGTIKDDRILRYWVMMDQIAFLERAGMLPEGAAMIFLSGAGLNDA